MMDNICPNIKAKGNPEWTSLFDHLSQVAYVAELIAPFFNMDADLARKGAILHDIGKVSSVFQERLNRKRKRNDEPFRHEIASCFFLSLFEEKEYKPLIEMVVAHHKSLKWDVNDLGLLDIEENRGDAFDLHILQWEEWHQDALRILEALGIPTHSISIEEAECNFKLTSELCEKLVKEQGYSKWRGLLMAADHFASALVDQSKDYADRLFKSADLSFFNRQHPLFPLSLKNSSSLKPHTIVVACTGAGKTDFLFRRCKGRVFYTLPFQASINAMFKRVKHDLADNNPNLDIRLLHSASMVSFEDGKPEEQLIQSHIGAAVKVLTPHQIASIAFGTRGYESMLLDLSACDIILDEIHTYSSVSQAIVLKIIQVLKHIGCRIHIGTATMPSLLYNKIIDLLGKEEVYEVKLEVDELNEFDRHTIHKLDEWGKTDSYIESAIAEDKKILLVCNRVASAQEQYKHLKDLYPEIPIMLLHSRFKRGDRNAKEAALLGLDDDGNPNGNFNTSNKACIVVSTQVVEVSLDISFDMMFTEAAPMDAMIQRFGRVNRKRNKDTIGHYKPIFVIAPPDDKNAVLPYELDIVHSSFRCLPDNDVLHESDLQSKIDEVFTDIDFLKIEEYAVFKQTGEWNQDKLTHSHKSILMNLLQIDSVSCICESDEERYQEATLKERMLMEISTKYYVVKSKRQLDCGSKPFIITDEAYSEELGFDQEKAKSTSYNPKYSFL